MEEFLRIKLKPGDLTGYIAAWGEYPTILRIGPYDFLWDNIEHVWWCSRNMTLYNERALSSMDSKILAYMAGFNIN